ncbi:DUF2127 domain-containing protein [Defluviimonas sp. SAOS-178_SWC]|uniref:DUF2127 domain-containing protein n=1 Tax=Defluviimonas sp. SAOS-178_SWC TaxID=3121287 RepID=UPI003221F4DB
MGRPFSAHVERRLRQLFDVSLIAKGAFAATELLSGIAIWLASADWVTRTVRWLTHYEIVEDPGDRVANWLLGLAQGYSVSTQNFWALYLIGHGVVKLVIVAALAFRILWAYPASILVLVGFILYQIERFSLTHAPFLIALTIFDLVVIWLVWHEYQRMKAGPEEP